MSMDSVTLIRSERRWFAKVVRPGPVIQGYDAVKTVDILSEPISGLDDIASLLSRLLRLPNTAAVFGGVADPARVNGVRRLAHTDSDTGDPPTLRAMAHRWCALDLDNIPRTDNVAAADLLACAALAIERLPPHFHGVRGIVQATAGHGLKPGCRLRLWYWLSRPTSGDELARWLKDYPVDPTTFRTAQPIYTASPVFLECSDHLPYRLAWVPGATTPVTVPTPGAPLCRPSQRPLPGEGPVTLAPLPPGEAARIVHEALARVRAAQDGEKHMALREAARLLGGLQEQVGYSDAEAVRWLLDALPGADDWHAAEKTARWGLEAGRQNPPQQLLASCGLSPLPTDTRKREIARLAFCFLRSGSSGSELMQAVHAANERRADPLPREIVNETIAWVARRQMESHHAHRS